MEKTIDLGADAWLTLDYFSSHAGDSVDIRGGLVAEDDRVMADILLGDTPTGPAHETIDTTAKPLARCSHQRRPDSHPTPDNRSPDTTKRST
ncbi:hypothetical protein [Microbacterium sp.]|uniref:hypothetical protein n=1 Tax=Microbacterium sp. TaxID=51671 RepID=UPI0028AE4E10|nr:hypothetical protein [Microbacterium sp.]